MIQKLMQYPKAWEKFVAWLKKDGQCEWDGFNVMLSWGQSRRANGYELNGLCIEFLDEQRIWLGFDTSQTSGLVMCDITTTNSYLVVDNADGQCYFPRQQATEAGIVRAFELLEQQLVAEPLPIVDKDFNKVKANE